MDAFSVIASIAEERIREAQERGDFEDLPGRGRPLPERDESMVPEELRMAFHILSNAGLVPPEVEERRQISNLCELVDRESDEGERLAQLRRLEALVLRTRLRSGRSLELHAQDDAYLDKVLDRLRSKTSTPGRGAGKGPAPSRDKQGD